MTTAFRTTLLDQFLLVLVLAVVLIVVWNVLRMIRYRQTAATGGSQAADPPRPIPEPPGRRFLRIAFGTLWLLDGLLVVQGSVPQNLPDNVLAPAGASSPGWVQHLVSVGATVWSNHPVTVAAAATWIQVGIGLFLIVAPRGYWSRSAGVVSAGWGLVVWMFGEAFGGIFAPGSSWLLGSPGAALFYVVAGALLALPDARWETPRLGRVLLRCSGAFLIGMGVLQALPGRGYWSGTSHSATAAGTLTTAVQRLTRLSQPTLTASWVRSFASFDAAHGWAVNLVAIVLLLAIGIGLASGRKGPALVSVVTGVGLCLADWVLVQDFGFFGGTGTNPNSMIPMIVVLVAGYLACFRPAALVEPSAQPATAGQPDAPAGHPAGRTGLAPSYSVRLLAALGAVGVLVLGVAPMAVAAVSPHADPIVSEVTDGTPTVVDVPAPPFALVDQAGRAVSLSSLRGHIVLLTFIDSVCTTDCPVIAQELRITDQMLGAEAARVDLVAVESNPLYAGVAYSVAFDKQEGLDQVPNWIFLTGTRDQLEGIWDDYGDQTAVSPAGAMVAHSDLVYVIDAQGRTRAIFNADPGGDTAATESSFSTLLAGQVRRIAPT